MRHRIFILLGAVGFLLTAIACGSVPRSSNSAESTPQPIEKRLSAFRPIQGTEFMIADISGNPQTNERDFSPFSWVERGYSGYSGYEIYNYVFFSGATETFNRLLPTNDYVVLQIIGFPSGTPTEKPEDFKPVMWWLYLLAKADTDQNGYLNYQDKLTIGVTDVGGNRPTEVISDIDTMLGQFLKDENTLFVFYHAGDKNHAAKIDLPGRQIVNTVEMDLGEDVK